MMFAGWLRFSARGVHEIDPFEESAGVTTLAEIAVSTTALSSLG